MRMGAVIVILGLLLVPVPGLQAAGADGDAQVLTPLVVGPGHPFATIPEALAAAAPGQRVEVQGGRHQGPITIDVPVTLVGTGRPVIEGTGRGSVFSIRSPGVTLQGFVIRHSGDDLATEDAGIVAQDAAGVTLLENELDDVLFGIHLKNAPGARVERNTIQGKPLPPARRGDGIRLWYSAGSEIRGNAVLDTRDVILWFSPETLVRSNRISGGRYGIHLMYNDRTRVEANVLTGNSVGTFIMYSRGVDLRDNLFLENRGPSGYGLGLKDVDEMEARGNLFVGNRVGLYLDNSPRLGSPSTNRILRNLLAYNDVGLSSQPSVRNNLIQANTFLDNLQQVSARGGGTLEGNRWSQDGLGNYWSDYIGYDADGDGVGDLAHRPASLLESLIDRKPELQFFRFSPAQQAVELAIRAFPILPSAPRLVDEAPLMEPIWPETSLLAGDQGRGSRSRGMGRLALSSTLAAGLLLAWSQGGRRNPRRTSRPDREVPGLSRPLPATPAPQPMVELRGLVKYYGENRVLDGIDLELHPGQSVALWGKNGAGKTTLLKCLLGLVSCSGTVRVAGLDVGRAGPAARQYLGYVPQEVRLEEDWTVWESLRFFARLRRLPESRAAEELERSGLAPKAAERVGSLSGGMRQRLALAIALLADPPLLLLDEPSANLDATARAHFHDRLNELRVRGKTLLFTTHRADEAIALADRVLVLRRGRIEVDAEPDRWQATLVGAGLTPRDPGQDEVDGAAPPGREEWPWMPVS